MVSVKNAAVHVHEHHIRFFIFSEFIPYSPCFDVVMHLVFDCCIVEDHLWIGEDHFNVRRRERRPVLCERTKL